MHNQEAALPGLRKSESLWLWGAANALSALGFATRCSAEARARAPESKLLRLYWALQFGAWFTAATVRLDPNASDGLHDPRGGAAGAFWALGTLVSLLFFSYSGCAAQARIQVLDTPDSRVPPETFAGPLSLAYFSWMTPLVVLGFTRPLEQTDLAHLHSSDDPVQLNKQFRDAWQAQVSAADARSTAALAAAVPPELAAPVKGPSLLRTLIAAFGPDYFVGVAVKFIYDSSQFIGPLLLQKIIVFLAARQAASEDDAQDAPPMRLGYELVFLLLVNSVFQSVLLHVYFHRAFRTGMRVKASVIAAIYDKALRVKPGAAAAAIPARKKAPPLFRWPCWGNAQTTKETTDSQIVPHKAPKKTPSVSTVSSTGKEVELTAVVKDGAAVAAAPAPPAAAAAQGKRKTTGEVVNLMAVDAQRLQDAMSYIAMLWSGVFQIVVSLWYLFDLMGPSVLAGVVIMLVSIPLTSKLAITQRTLQSKVSENSFHVHEAVTAKTTLAILTFTDSLKGLPRTFQTI